MGITVSYKGDLKKTVKYLKSSRKVIKMKDVEYFAQLCVERLKDATPVDTGLTQSSWEYSIERDRNNVIVNIDNTNIQNGINIAILIDTGHATRDGRYIPGLQFISPIINNTFKEIIDSTWKELKSL